MWSRTVRGVAVDVRERYQRSMSEWITSFRVIPLDDGDKSVSEEVAVDFFGRFIDGKFHEGDVVRVRGRTYSGVLHTREVFVERSKRGHEVSATVRGKWFDRRALIGLAASTVAAITFGTWFGIDYYRASKIDPVERVQADCWRTQPPSACRALFSKQERSPTADAEAACRDTAPKKMCDRLFSTK